MALEHVAGPHRWHHTAHEITALSRAHVGRCVPTSSWLAFHRQQFHHCYDTSCLRALSGVDALLQACSEKLTAQRATSLISTVFTEGLVRQRVLSCNKVLAIHHFESAVGELLDSPDFSANPRGFAGGEGVTLVAPIVESPHKQARQI